MTTERDQREFQDRIGALREQVVDQLASEIALKPELADTIDKYINDMIHAVVSADNNQAPPPDNGLAQLIGIGPQAANSLGETRLPHQIAPYDEHVMSERLLAIGDLYYIYQHETIGIFRVVQKLQELFRAGIVRLSEGPGAYALYQFDRREVLRYTRRDRLMAYRRAFGYGQGPVAAGSRPNSEFHTLFSHFINQVVLYWRDKRVSDVIRERSYDPSFGSVAIVRRAGLDLRNNLKLMSFGHLNVMRVEVMQLLEEAFRILNSDDIKRLYGADNAWDVVEDVLVRHFRERLATSPRQRMAVAGRDILRWLSQGHILQDQRTKFEAMLLSIAEPCEEWLTSAQSLGLADRNSQRPGEIWNQARPSVPAKRNGRPKPSPRRQYELEYEL
jgi:hypothetical protein